MVPDGAAAGQEGGDIMYQIRLYHYGKVVKTEQFETAEAMRKKYILYQQRDNLYAECVIDGKALKTGEAYRALQMHLPAVPETMRRYSQ